MKKHEELSNPHGTLSKAHVDEPVFIIRAQDKHALEILSSVTAIYKARKVKKEKTDKVVKEYKLFQDWQEENKKSVKQPD